VVEQRLATTWFTSKVEMLLWDDTNDRVVAGPWTLGTDRAVTDAPFYCKVVDGNIVVFRSKSVFVFASPYAIKARVRTTYKESSSEPNQQWSANNPYHEFFTLDHTSRTVALPWRQGDTTARFARPSTTYQVRYKSLFPPATGTDPNVRPVGVPDNGYAFSPFYDPYTSELGHLVRCRFDVLAEGSYRVSIRSAVDNTVVAWLTGGDADPQEPEKHWGHLPVGAAEFYWDGVDAIGEWNTRQSELYARLVDGAFGEDGAVRERVGLSLIHI
jgi:hypothetical protein